jgi:hypothetical protein
LQDGSDSAAIVFMILEKRFPNVYGQHSLLDEAAEPFASIPGHLVLSEFSESPDWWLTLWRQDGTVLQVVLPTIRRMQLRAALINDIQDGLTAMVAAAPRFVRIRGIKRVCSHQLQTPVFTEGGEPTDEYVCAGCGRRLKIPDGPTFDEL